LKTAEEFVKIVLELVQKDNPQLRFSFNNGIKWGHMFMLNNSVVTFYNFSYEV